MFETYIYQPFFNILVGIYWLLGRLSPELLDMGIAVIIFSLVVRLFTFPLTIASERKEEEKRKIAGVVEELKARYSHDPILAKQEVRKVMRANKRTVLATSANLIIQLIIIVMLYRIFTTGLEGEDFHLLYPFMPQINSVNLLFLGKYDLSHTNATLNLIQSAMIFIVELLLAIRSPFPVSRRDVTMLQFVLPVGSYLVFLAMPAGKKVFIITSLVFSTIYNSIRIIQSLIARLSERFTKKVEATPSESPLPPEN
ncbi:MAG: 60 kDa inner membrane insertion protein [Microgenomates group bacterium GW2011_GWF2_47_9]|nr:MAG: 60 kDa inner membrane insertion protein [Microgenomates group bacterium GW2011_GWF2_47_9]